MPRRAHAMFFFKSRSGFCRFEMALERTPSFLPRISTDFRRRNGASERPKSFFSVTLLAWRFRNSENDSVACFVESRESTILGSRYSSLPALLFAHGKNDHNVSCVPAG